jgi:hypothetical protein
MITLGIQSASELGRDPADRLAPGLRGPRWGTGPAVLLGVDGAAPGMSTPIQTSMIIDAGGRSPKPSSSSLKVYPTEGETASLVGWHRVVDGDLDLSRQRPRRCRVGPLTVAPLICHEAAVFAGRSISRRSNSSARTQVADYLARSIKNAQCIALMLHWVDRGRVGSTFLNAARELARQSDAFVVVSTFAPRRSLEIVARRFDVHPHEKRGRRVATLFVRDAA